MVGANRQYWGALERWSPTLFLFASALLVGYAVLNGIATVTDSAFVTVEDIVGPAGFVLGFVGLLGLYPRLADRSPILALAGACCASAGVVGFSVITVQGLAVMAGVESVNNPGVFLLFATIGMILGYLSMGVAAVRTNAYPRLVGLLLFVPALVFAVMLSQAILFVQFGLFSETTMAWSAFAISVGQAVAHLAIGYTLRVGPSPAERDVSATDATVS